jgi:SnoaL-like domain
MTLRSVTILLAGFIFGASPTNPAHQQSNNKDRRPPDQSSIAICRPLENLSSAQFELLLQTIRSAWLEGNQERATACFSSGVVFSTPPAAGLVGRESLVRLFSLGPHQEPPKRIEWHHLIFDPAQQIGAAEYTIQRRIPTHGVIIIKLSHGLICNWRQYAIASDLTWEKFSGMNDF